MSHDEQTYLIAGVVIGFALGVWLMRKLRKWRKK